MSKLALADLSELRRRVGCIDGSVKEERFSFSLFPKGFALGSVVEIYGIGRTQCVLSFLQEHGDLTSAWVEEEVSVYPNALIQKRVDLSHLIFIETLKESLWSCQQILQSQIFKVMVFSGLRFNTRQLQRFQLSVEKSQSLLILLSEKPHESWVPSVVLQTHRQLSGELEVHAIRQKGVL